MSKIKAFWYFEQNFGDALAPYLIQKLSGMEVVYTPAAHRIDIIREWKRFWTSPFHYDWHRISWPETKKDVIMSIGSILEHSRPNYQIWGTGFMNVNGTCKGGYIHAVRGKMTAKQLADLGVSQCDVYGDPALLLPRVYQPRNKRCKGKVGIIPHILELDKCKHEYANYHVVSLRTDDVESVIDEIYSCDLVVSSSLHGIIIAHAYGIPALWVKATIDVGGGDFKYMDYFSSINKVADSVTHEELKAQLKLNLDSFRSRAVRQMPSREVVATIQAELMRACPFPVLKEWK